MKTRLRTRAFLLCSLPFALLLTCGFWLVQREVQSTVRESLETSLRERQAAIAALHAKAELQDSRFLKVAGENSALKAGVQLLLTYPHNIAAQRTVEDQLRELGERMGFDFMRVSVLDGSPVAAVVRQPRPNAPSGEFVPLDLSQVDRSGTGILVQGGRMIQVASVPIDVGAENIGVLSVGEFFDLSHGATQVVLVRNGKVVDSNLAGVARAAIERSLSGCSFQSECDFSLAGSHWISLPMESYGDGYELLSLENVDAATAPIESQLRTLFTVLGSLFMVVALVCSFAVSSSIVKPIGAIVQHLRNAARTGKLTELHAQRSSILEINELAAIYDRAAISVRQAGDQLDAAYLEFVSAMASALDARDPYTAGHSWRVSQVACALAAVVKLPAQDIERIRIGALLHDIGKIGIPDAVLQKPGRLTREEFDLIKQHPVIGRRILESVQGFAPYLAAVELHHENWNGTGYPHGQRGEETPIDARIIHVADAYDAMVTDRSYRRSLTHERAAEELVTFAGIQFDPHIVEAFLLLPRSYFEQHQEWPAAVAAPREVEPIAP
jgi:putative nucleotidyltransferase with HDIG domain